MAFIRRRTRGVSAGVFSFPVVVTCEVYIRQGLCFVHAACRVLIIKESRVPVPTTDKIVSRKTETRYTQHWSIKAVLAYQLRQLPLGSSVNLSTVLWQYWCDVGCINSTFRTQHSKLNISSPEH